jgi:hypothetical protein
VIIVKRYVNTILVMLITLIAVMVLVNIKPNTIAYSKNNLEDKVNRAFNNDSNETGSFIFDY